MHVLLDFGNVISRPPRSGTLTAMAQRVQVEPDGFAARYRANRRAYDRGLPGAEFWARVLERPATAEELTELVARDIAVWTDLDQEVLAAIDHLRERGVPLSLLSNMPFEIGAHLSTLPVFTGFAHVLFSCDVGLVKPEPEIYHLALERLEPEHPADVVFVDDREENITAARNAGLRGVHWPPGRRDLLAALGAA